MELVLQQLILQSIARQECMSHKSTVYRAGLFNFLCRSKPRRSSWHANSMLNFEMLYTFKGMCYNGIQTDIKEDCTIFKKIVQSSLESDNLTDPKIAGIVN